jgi:cardiolipin synthase (CMP-forming)
VKVQETAVQTDRVLTIPNILSFLRLAALPVFVWLALVKEADGWAFFLLGVSGATDFLDGYIARATGQISRLGQLLDPIADRLYTVTVLVVLLIRGIVPLWFVAVLIVRDVVLSIDLMRLKRKGVTGLPVHFIGKAATFCLLIAFPFMLLGSGPTTAHEVSRAFGWAFGLWGAGMYVWAAVLYLIQSSHIRRLRTATA